ncbi:MAG TPA: hypothetical protein VHW66_10525 [Stellaceae bacterium]|nr:hypothetical protein [Stellaceae bacterium]
MPCTRGRWRIFEEVNRQIDGRGLIPRQGTLIDASLIPAAVNPPKQPKQPPPPGPDGKPASLLVQLPLLVKSARDPEAEWAKKGGRRYFGYKVHVGVDKGSAHVWAGRATRRVFCCSARR